MDANLSPTGQKWSSILSFIKITIGKLTAQTRSIEAKKESLTTVLQCLEELDPTKSIVPSDLLESLHGIHASVDVLRSPRHDAAFSEALSYIVKLQSGSDTSLSEAVVNTKKLLEIFQNEALVTDDSESDFVTAVSACLEEDRVLLQTRLEMWLETIQHLQNEEEYTHKMSYKLNENGYKNVFSQNQIWSDQKPVITDEDISDTVEDENVDLAELPDIGVDVEKNKANKTRKSSLRKSGRILKHRKKHSLKKKREMRSLKEKNVLMLTSTKSEETEGGGDIMDLDNNKCRDLGLRNTNKQICEICDTEFANHRKLETHLRLVHQKEKSFSCKDCPKQFIHETSLAEHQKIHKDGKNINPKEKSFKCKYCSKVYDKRHKLKKHYKSAAHNSDKEFCCDQCGQQYRSLALLYEHQRTHMNIRPFKCDKCDKAFFRETNLKNHKDIHLTYKQYICKICQKAFKQQVGLYIHQRVHAEKRLEHQCDTCNKLFTSKLSLRLHIKNVHENNRIYPCSECDRTFKYSSALKHHKISHSGIKRFVCPICGQRFVTADTLKRHQIVHTGQKEHLCDLCSKAFGTAYNLKRHMLSHEGATPYPCKICDKAFTSAAYRRKHIRIHEKDDSISYKRIAKSEKKAKPSQIQENMHINSMPVPQSQLIPSVQSSSNLMQQPSMPNLSTPQQAPQPNIEAQPQSQQIQLVQQSQNPQQVQVFTPANHVIPTSVLSLDSQNQNYDMQRLYGITGMMQQWPMQ